MCDDEQELRELREKLEALEPAADFIRGALPDGVYPQGFPTDFALLGGQPRPDKYYPDGKPILTDELLPATLKWAMLFEQTKERIVGRTNTLYGERLSTVWLGLDHNFWRIGPPLIYETMLFAPSDRKAERDYLRDYAGGALTPEREAAYNAMKAHTAKHYPHDQLQLRYSTRKEAEDKHHTLKLQCLIPPRWRHFLLGRVYGDPTWLHYDDEDGTWWT